MATFHMSHRPLPHEAEEELRRTYPHAAWHLEASDALSSMCHPALAASATGAAGAVCLP